MNIKKITNVKTSPSEEKIINDWKQIKSFKIKLLQDSDWIFVKDSRLTDACINSWIKWRDRVKKVNEIDSIQEAYDYLNALSNNKPELLYLNEKPKTLDLYKKLLLQALNDNIKIISEMISEEFGNRDILVEKFEEAIRYKSNNNNYVLIKIEAEMTNSDIETVANNAIKNRQSYLKKIIKLEKSIHYYREHVKKVESFDECDKLLDSIIKMQNNFK